MTQDLEPYQTPATPAPYDPGRNEAMKDLIKAQIMPPRTDKQGKVLGPASDEETELMVAQANALGLSILAGQARPIRFERGGPCTLFVEWQGLVKLAQDTGEYGGIEAILYTDGTKVPLTDEWGNARMQYVWQDGWDSTEPPVACKVGIWRKGATRPSWGIAHYSTWATQPDPDGWSDKKNAQGKTVQRQNRSTGEWYNVREHNGKRVPKPGEWWAMPGCIHKLAISALRIILKANFQPDQFRKATMAAARDLSREERLALAAEIVGEDVETFNQLEPGQYAEVYDALASRGHVDTAYDDQDTQPALTQEQAAPISPGVPSAAGADPSQFGASIPIWAQRGSAGRAETAPAGTAPDHAAPAEHHTAEDSGEVAPADGTEPGGPDRSDTGQPSGPAPTPAAPRRTRRAPKPDLKAEAREATAKRQTIYHGPRNWVQSIADVDTKRDLLKLFGGKISDTHIFVQRFVDQDPDLPSDIAEWTDRDWEPDKLRALLVTAEAEKGGS